MDLSFREGSPRLYFIVSHKQKSVWMKFQTFTGFEEGESISLSLKSYMRQQPAVVVA